MLVQVNTDNHIKGHADLNRYVQNAVQGALGRFEPQLVRVVLDDENATRDDRTPPVFEQMNEARRASLRDRLQQCRRALVVTPLLDRAIES